MIAAMVSVQRLSARARLDSSPGALAHARAQADAGDESWGQWLAEYQRGDALIVCLELSLELGDDSGEVITLSQDGFFVETHVHAPRVEQQIAELVSGDLAALADAAVQRGHTLERHELAGMYVHVELDPNVRRRVQDGDAPA